MIKSMLKCLPAILLPVASPCSADDIPLQDGDLLFCIAQSSDMSDAIVDATKTHRHLQYDHVAIYLTVDDTPSVIEAAPRYGVAIRSLSEFMNDNPAGVTVKRVTIPIDLQAALQRARTFQGQPYDWSFRPDNGKMYCSELVYESYLDSTGKPIFTASPMSFRNDAGEIPAFWTELFNRIGEEIPEGIPGTNPNTMQSAPILQEIPWPQQ